MYLLRYQLKKAVVELEYSGEGLDEIATVKFFTGDNIPALKVGDVIVRVVTGYFDPAEVETLLGAPSKAKEKLGWVPQITLE
jgi:GDPmannose 4,6-dehydratase